MKIQSNHQETMNAHLKKLKFLVLSQKKKNTKKLSFLSKQNWHPMKKTIILNPLRKKAQITMKTEKK